MVTSNFPTKKLTIGYWAAIPALGERLGQIQVSGQVSGVTRLALHDK